MKLPRRSLVAVVVALLVVMTACQREQPEVPVVPDAVATTGAATPTRTPRHIEVPELCEDLIAYTRLLEIIAVPMDGSNDRVYNDEDLANSGRTARLTCSFGVPFDLPAPPVTTAPTPTPSPTPGPPPALVIAVSSYTDTDVARARVEGTVADVQGRGGTVAARPLAGIDGFLLADAEDVSYVVADGPLTYVVTLRRGLVPPAEEEAELVAVVAEVLGVEDVAPTPTATSTPTSTPTATSTPTPASSPTIAP